MVSRSLPWQWNYALFAIVFAATVVAGDGEIFSTNATTGIAGDSSEGRIILHASNGTNLTALVPLTKDATMADGAPLQGNLYYTTPDTVPKIANTDIGYLNCDPGQGNMGAIQVLQQLMAGPNLIAVILYSTTADYCDYQLPTEQMQEFPIFSTTNRADAADILKEVQDVSSSPSEKYFVNIVGRNTGGSGQEGGNRQQQHSPLGPSPSTAVAMIILYSITGIITALFLVIIITGAVRAHRHPDRYGPRDVLGRPRQSRARGLGRAILDTIPIVKFGERESEKPTDVELGSTAEARNVNAETTTETPDPTVEQTGTDSQQPAHRSEMPQHINGEQPSGIAPAVGSAAVGAQPDSSPEGLGCSICTDDFEKGQDIRVLPCNHKFHPECVDPWLLNVSGTCPLCRVDLRPTTSHSSTEEDQDPDMLAPPLQQHEADTTHRRRSTMRDILSFRSRPNASAEERISALRRLREQRRNQSGDVASSENDSTEDVAAARRSRRISMRLSNVFGGRTRHGQDDAAGPVAEPSTSQPAIAAEPRSSTTTDPQTRS